MPVKKRRLHDEQSDKGLHCLQICLHLLEAHTHMNHVMRKPVFGVSDQVGHKPGCTDTEDG